MASRKPCTVCGSEDGPAVYQNDEECSVYCKKFMNGTMPVEKYEAMTGRRQNPATGFWDFPTNLQKAAK